MTGTTGTGSGEFGVLVVCTANVCRSPLAEALLRAGLGTSSGVRVTSAGVRAPVGSAPDARMAARSPVPMPDRGARQLGAELLREADLVLTMTRDHRRTVVTTLPRAVRRTFTIREFADLTALAADGGAVAAASPAEALAEVVAAAPRLRARRDSDAEDDIEDPFDRADALYDRVAADIATAVATVLHAVGTPPRSFG